MGSILQLIMKIINDRNPSNIATEQESILDPFGTEMSPGTSTPKPGQPANQISSASQPTNSDLRKNLTQTMKNSPTNNPKSKNAYFIFEIVKFMLHDKN